MITCLDDVMDSNQFCLKDMQNYVFVLNHDVPSQSQRMSDTPQLGILV